MHHCYRHTLKQPLNWPEVSFRFSIKVLEFSLKTVTVCFSAPPSSYIPSSPNPFMAIFYLSTRCLFSTLVSLSTCLSTLSDFYIMLLFSQNFLSNYIMCFHQLCSEDNEDGTAQCHCSKKNKKLKYNFTKNLFPLVCPL